LALSAVEARLYCTTDKTHYKMAASHFAEAPKASKGRGVEESRPFSCLTFGVFEADLCKGELRKHGLKIKLQPQAFRLLVYLLEHQGEVFTPEHLRNELWPQDALEFKEAVKVAITRIRAALGDSPTNPRFVETVSRRGYRFIVPVQELDASPGGTHHPAHKVKVAVFPFNALSPDSAQPLLTAGLAGEVLTELSLLDPQRLSVVASWSPRLQRGEGEHRADISSQLGADYVVRGSIGSEHGKVHVKVQLTRVRDNANVWAATYEGKAADPLTLHKEVAHWIARSVESELLSPGRSRAPVSLSP
jgi:DNA-binding winged helix-turn-helix (wHTH) protein